MKKHLYLLAFLLFSLTSVALADDPPDFDDENPDGIPADGGLTLLAMSGGVYAYRKLKARKKGAASDEAKA